MKTLKLFHSLIFQADGEDPQLPMESGVIVFGRYGESQIWCHPLILRKWRYFLLRNIPWKSWLDPTLRTCHETLSPTYLVQADFPYMYPFIAERHLWQRKDCLIYWYLTLLGLNQGLSIKQFIHVRYQDYPSQPLLLDLMKLRSESSVQCHEANEWNCWDQSPSLQILDQVSTF